MKHLILIIALCFSTFFIMPAIAQEKVQNQNAKDKVIHIYQDADISNHSQSSMAIQKGIELAFDELDNQIGDYKVIFKYLDHRGNVVRSKQNYQKFIDDPKALAIYSGIHSPPLIKNRTFINENDALTLVPWAAGGPITRHPSEENWIFRLSVDDTRAGPVLVDFAMKQKGCTNPDMMLESTPWGDSNLKSMTKALTKHNIKNPHVTRFNWNITSAGARQMLLDMVSENHDCILLVANAIEGIIIINEIAKMDADKRPKIISHWGITGGNFHEKVPAEIREKIDLHFIQTCFAFTNEKQSEFQLDVFNRLNECSNGEYNNPSDLKSAVGFIHAYDLSKILIQAIKQAGLTGDMSKDRDAVRLALENIKKPVKGLVKTYKNPFSVFSEDNFNAHEALKQEDYCMGHYGKNDEIIIGTTTQQP